MRKCMKKHLVRRCLAPWLPFNTYELLLLIMNLATLLSTQPWVPVLPGSHDKHTCTFTLGPWGG